MSNLTDFLYPKATEQQAKDGASNSVLMTPLRTSQAISEQVPDMFPPVALSKYYESPETVVVSSSSPVVFAHGLGEVPKIVQVFVKFNVGVEGYASGDLVYLGGATHSSRIGGVSAGITATQIKVFVRSQFILVGSGATSFEINADRPIVVRAFA